jgi:YVTN family beta-propeller protein
MEIEIYSTDTDSGVLSVIRRNDDGAYVPLGQIPVGNAPRGAVRFTRGGRGYVSNCGGDTISEIDLVNHRETARIKVGPAPRGIGIIPGEQFALVSNSGDNSISIVDLLGREEVRRIAVGRDPRHMAVTADGSFAYVAIWGS